LAILREILVKLKEHPLTQQVRTLCALILEEEMKEMPFWEYGPVGPNIFLCLEVPGHTTKHIGFLTLEREEEELYLAVFWALEKSKILPDDPENTLPARKKKVWEIKHFKAEKILTEYAKRYKQLRGE
jgi:hypothetical protein